MGLRTDEIKLQVHEKNKKILHKNIEKKSPKKLKTKKKP